jgi:hypothetical protein
MMESIVETKASSILQLIHGLRGGLHVTWEEGTWAAWLYDLLQPEVAQVLVCYPRRNGLLKEGNKSDKIDARKLADLLRTGMLGPVYHGEHRYPSQLWCESVTRLLCGFAGERHEARDGASDVSTKDRGHWFDTLE